jgi:hypothetical protein
VIASTHRAPVRVRPDGLVRKTLKKAYADGTIAVDMDSRSLLRRLAPKEDGAARIAADHRTGIE